MDEQSVLDLVVKFLKSKRLDKTASILGEELGKNISSSTDNKKSGVSEEELSQLYNALKINGEIDEVNATTGGSFSSPKDVSLPVSINSGAAKHVIVEEIASSPEVSGDLSSELSSRIRPDDDIIVEEEFEESAENEESENHIGENGNAVDIPRKLDKNPKGTISFDEETIREMEILRNTQEAAENLNENTENRDIGSRNSSNLRSRTGSTSSARSSKSVSFATSSDEEDAGEISDEWSDDDDPGYQKIPSETLEYFQYSDDEENENEGGIDMQLARISNTLNVNVNTNPNSMENENYDWEPATQEEALHTPTGNPELPVGTENTNESFGHDEFEVEKLNQILSDHIQLQRDEYYQESFGDLGQPPKQWNDKTLESPRNPPVNESKMEEEKPSVSNQPETADVETPNVDNTVPQKETYPNPALEFKNIPDEVQFESFNLPIICERGRTGLQESKDFPIEVNSIIAGRYQIVEYLGSAAFSKAIRCLDMVTSNQVCIKIIKNNKEYLDQSLDEIRLLQYINSNGDPDQKNVLQLYDYFYHKEHLFIVCELLRDNLYEFYKYNRESSDEFYFNIPRLKKITKQCLVALEFIHGLKLIHCDLKPENILIKSYSRCEVKIIDFGSSCFTRDHLSSYVQSRSYRAPEVILGMSYDSKIDIWSLGCILAELWTGKVLFNNESIPTLLARVAAILGPFDKEMLKSARYAHKYFTKNCALYEKREGEPGYTYLRSKRTTLKNRLKCDDPVFVDFISKLLTVNPAKRPTASEALKHLFVKDV